MTAVEFLAGLRERGGVLLLNLDGTVKYRGPELTDRLRAFIRDHKSELESVLKSEQDADPFLPECRGLCGGVKVIFHCYGICEGADVELCLCEIPAWCTEGTAPGQHERIPRIASQGAFAL